MFADEHHGAFLRAISRRSRNVVPVTLVFGPGDVGSGGAWHGGFLRQGVYPRYASR